MLTGMESKIVKRYLLMVLAGVLLAGVLTSCGGGKYVNRLVRGTVFAMPASEDVPEPDLLITNWLPSRSTETYYISYVVAEGNKHRVLWEIEMSESDHWYLPRGTYDGEHVYYIVEDRLLALSRTDGSTTWTARLSDLVNFSCTDCIQRVGEVIVVLTSDYVLQGISTRSGTLAWSVRLSDSASSREGFSVDNGRVILLDDLDPDSHQTAIHVYDAAKGNLVRKVFPVCPESEDTPRFLWDEVFIDLSSTRNARAIFLYDCFPDPYVQSWDLVTGQLVWDERLPDEADTMIDSYVIGSEKLYLEMYTGLFSVDLSTGRTQLVSEEIDPDYDFLPLFEHQGQLIGWARRTRGSSRYELWALSPSGDRLWEHTLVAESEPGTDLDPDDWVYRMVGDYLLLIQVSDEPDELLVSKLDPQTGQVVLGSGIKNDYNDLYGIAWIGEQAYVTMGLDLYQIDLEMATISLIWP
jgi:outer membrane protein assembly factor BamB